MILLDILKFLTIDVETDPLADGGRDVVAGDAEVGPHVLAPHPVDLQRVPGPDVHRPAQRVSDVSVSSPGCDLCW